MSRQVRSKIKIQDTLAFVEDWDFLTEFTECGLTDDDRDNLETVITVRPDSGSVVPVSTNVRDLLYCFNTDQCVIVRYVRLWPSTVLLLSAYLGEESLHMTAEEAAEAESYVEHQTKYFLRWHTR